MKTGGNPSDIQYETAKYEKSRVKRPSTSNVTKYLLKSIVLVKNVNIFANSNGSRKAFT
jgi:hypothetical protein